MATANLLLERWSALRLFRRLTRPLGATAVILAVSVSLLLPTLGPFETHDGIEEAGKRFSLLVWAEFLLVLIMTCVESAASIAEERRNGTWDAICQTDLGNREIARGKLLGSLLAPALLLLLALPAHLTFTCLGQARWEVVAGVHAVLAGSSLAVAAIGVVASSYTTRALHALALAAAVVLFPWFALLDWLAGRGIVPWLCRLLHPVRHLEWLLAVGSAATPSSTAGRGLLYLVFAVIVATGSWLIAAGRLRRPGSGSAIKLKLNLRHRRSRTVWNDAVLWRECHEPGGRRIVIVVGLATVILMLGSVSAAMGRESQGIRYTIAQHDNALLSTLLLASGVATGLRASVTLVDERVRRTIEPLFLAGIEPIELVRSKLAAIFRPLWPILFLVLILAVIGFGELSGYLTRAAWLGAAGVVLSVLAFNLLTAGLALGCSSLMRSTRSALLAWVGLLIAHILGTLLVGVGLSLQLPERVSRILATASPIMQISIVHHEVTGHNDGINVPMLLGVLAAELALGLSAIALAVRRLERDSRPSRA